jgi:hypothetical protein
VVAATGGSAAGAWLSTVVGWAVGQYCPAAMPDNARSAVAILYVVALTAGFTFVSGYLTRPSGNDVVAPDRRTGRPRIARVRADRRRRRRRAGVSRATAGIGARPLEER